MPAWRSGRYPLPGDVWVQTRPIGSAIFRNREQKIVKFQPLALAPIILFILLRAIIYRLYPVQSFEDWVQVDFIKNIPRLLCLVLALFVAKKVLTNSDRNIFRVKGWKHSLKFLALTLIFYWVAGFWNPPAGVSTQQILIISFGSLCAAIFEEFSFRFLLLRALLDSLMTERKALILSSLAFMIFHVQAQPLYTWPYLFAAGIQYGALRLMGVSLFWLILVHAGYDTIIFYLATANQSLGYAILTVCNLSLALYYWNQRIVHRVSV